MAPLNEANLSIVRGGRILFTHHSVGANVLAGVARLDAGIPGGALRMVALEQGDVVGPALFHGGGGRNGEPKSKIHTSPPSSGPGRVPGLTLPS